MKYIPLLALIFVASCAEGHYPLSGEECGHKDPLLSLDATHCAIPTLG